MQYVRIDKILTANKGGGTQMQVLGILLVDFLVLIMIGLIVFYLVQDRRRFRVENQFRAVKGLFDEWAAEAGALPGCEQTAEQYRRTKNISRKYILLAELEAQSHGRQTPRMRELARRLGTFLDVYTALAEDYNRHRMGRVRETVTRWMGFRPLPLLRPEE